MGVAMKQLLRVSSIFILLMVGLVIMTNASLVAQDIQADNIDAASSVSDEKYLAIVDVYVTNRTNSSLTPPDPGYTGVTYAKDIFGSGFCTEPYVENDTGTFVQPTDINRGLTGGLWEPKSDWVHIWVKYDWVAPTDDTPVLVDIDVRHWPYWNVNCRPGMEPARGDKNGALTTNAKSDCLKIGLCVKYAPMNETETFVSNLSLSYGDSLDSGDLHHPPICWANEGYWPMKQIQLDIHQSCNDDYWMFLNYSQARPSPPLPESLPEPTDAEKVHALKSYAPQVWLSNAEPGYDNEIYFPSSVEWFFTHMQRVWTGPGPEWRVWSKDPLGDSTGVLDFFHGCDGNPTSRSSACQLEEAPVYAFWDKKELVQSIIPLRYGIAYDLVYFFFFPYNRGKDTTFGVFGNHVGDWEHVTVRMLPYWDNAAGWSFKPASIYISSHDFGHEVFWNEIDKTPGYIYFDCMPYISQPSSAAQLLQTPEIAQESNVAQADSSGKHPIVYAAWGSHGIWKTAGEHLYKETAVGDLVDYTGRGEQWNTWQNVKAFLYAEDEDGSRGLDGNSWPVWMSPDHHNPALVGSDPASGPIYRWGNNEDGCYTYDAGDSWWCQLEAGPTGPIDKGVWNSQNLR